MADAPGREPDAAKAKPDATALAEQAEAEAAEAEAQAAAARAHAKAIRSRDEAQARAENDAAETTAVTEAADVTADVTAETPETDDSPVPWTEPTAARIQAPGISTILAGVALVAVLALLGVSGWLLWLHHGADQERQRSAAFVAAAKQGVINVTTMDFNKAKEDIQRVIDSSTGKFREDYQRSASDFESVAKEAKAISDSSITLAAVESMQKDSAVVLVLGTERVTNAAGAKDEPRVFQFRVSVVRESGQLKISKIDLVI